MKSDHLFEDLKQKSNTPITPNNMFNSKLHPHSLSPLQLHPHQHQHQHQHQHTLLHHHQQQQEQLSRECHNNNSEEDDSRSSGGAIGGAVVEYGQSSGGRGVGPLSKKPKTTETHSGGGGGGTGGGGDGASIEVSRRPRGRPPGSKNKPKPPIIITRDNECAMRPLIFEISSGLDIIDSISRFALQRSVGLCVLTASGTVLNVSLRQPTNSTVTFHGRFDILSISVTCLPPSHAHTFTNGCTISLAGPQGQIFGGTVAGALIAATNVFVVATTFTSLGYHRLPSEEEQVANTSEDQDSQVEPPSTGGASAMEGHSTPTDSGAMTMYNCNHLASDVIWTPTARPPSQHF